MKQIQCPTCGASISSLIANCSYCGTEIARASTIEKQEYIKAIQHRIEKAIADDDAKNVSNAISLIPIPSDISLLVELFMFCHGNRHECNNKYDADEVLITEAWFLKAAAAYERLSMASLNDKQLFEFLQRYEVLYSPKALKEKEEGKLKHDRMEMFVVLGAVFFCVVLGSVMFYFITKAL